MGPWRKLDQVKLMNAVDAKRQEEGMTWLDLSIELDFATPSTLYDLRYRLTRAGKEHVPRKFTADRMIALMTWLGTTDFKLFLRDD